MNYRVTDSKSSLMGRIAVQQARLATLNEQLTTGKRINRASDDPYGAEAVINLRISQTEVDQFARSAETTYRKLITSDDTLNAYGNTLDKVRMLVSRALSDTTTPESKAAIATELEMVRAQVLTTANTKYGDEFVFGGTRQDAPPFDPVTGIPAATPATSQYIQIEPGANAIASGVTAEGLFSDATATIFTDLDAAIAAMRGTGDPVADKATLVATTSRLVVYDTQLNTARIRIGANMNTAEIVQERLDGHASAYNDLASSIEGADFVETAVAVSRAQQALEATLQVTATRQRTLFDFLA